MQHASEEKGIHTGFLMGKSEERRPLGRPRCRREDTIKMDLRIGTGLSWLRIWTMGDPVNKVMNLWVP
jgi:hypothetical protein